MNTKKNSIIAKRYAKSLLDLTLSDGADEKKSAQAMLDNLRNIKIILESSDDLYTLMTNPVISAKDKEEIIDTVFYRDTDETARNALKLLVNKNRFGLIYSIIEIFSNLVDELNKIVKVDVTCAVELDEKNKFLIQEKLKEKLHKTVEANYKINESIIAGLIYKIGDDVIDTSVYRKLEKLKQEIIK